MSFNKYYQDELSFLREMGKEFARAYPAAAQFLADRGSDPDVERLLEGFAFLTGRLRQKLDDEFPELTHAMMNLLWPHYLRPIPSVSMIEFTPIPGAVTDRQQIARGAEVASTPVEGTPCRFRTAFNVDLYPFMIEKADLEMTGDGYPSLRLCFRMSQGVPLVQAGVENIRIHLSGEPSYSLYLWLCHYTTEVRLRPFVQGKPVREITVPSSKIRPVGFSKEEALLPYPGISFDGYRLLQEYFTFPEKFLFIDLSDIGQFTNIANCDSFEIVFIFSRQPAASLRVSKDNIRLFCTPVVNLLQMESDPVRVTHDRVEYRIRPAGTNPMHYEIYSIERATGWVRGTAKEQEYEPFYSFKHGLGPSGRKATYYQTHLKSAVLSDGTDTYVSFVNIDQETMIPPTETVVFNLTCTNRGLAGKLRVGDIQIPTDSSPEFAQFQNISKVTPSIRIPIGGDLYWRLISHLTLNYISISNIQALRGILELYNIQALYDRQASRANERRIEGIQDIQSQAEDLLFHGLPVRGISTSIAMKEDHYAGEGDMFLFASILNEFFTLYASLNSFSHLTVRGVQQGEIYRWQPRIGQQMIL